MIIITKITVLLELFCNVANLSLVKIINVFRVLIEQWIRAKYEREEFCQPDRQSYLSGSMVGFLMKRGKEDSRYQLRKFVLNENEDTLK